MMKSNYERLVELEEQVAKLLAEKTKSSCQCGGQNCGPNYKPTKDK